MDAGRDWSTDNLPSIEDLLDHIDHACQLVGSEHVAATTHGFDPIFMQVFGNGCFSNKGF